MQKTLLDGIQQETKQKIYECLSQAIGEDRQEADAVLELKTHVSGPFLNWDLIYRNLINAFSDDDVLYSTSKRGMWEVLLLLDKKSGLVLSFMRDTRFEVIKKAKVCKQPQYIRSLVSLNAELQAPHKQQSLFEVGEPADETQIERILDEMCVGFEDPVNKDTANYTLIVFSNQYGRIGSFKAYVLDKDLDVVCEQDWLENSSPIMSNEVDVVQEKAEPRHALKQKSLDRLHRKELVALKEKELEKQA